MPAVRKTQKKKYSQHTERKYDHETQSCELGGMNKKRGIVFMPCKTIQGEFCVLGMRSGIQSKEN